MNLSITSQTTRAMNALLKSRALRILCALALVLGGVSVKEVAAPATAQAAPTFLSEYLNFDNDQFIANMEANADRYLGTPYSMAKRMEGPGKNMDCSSFVGFALVEQAGVSADFWATLVSSGERTGWPGTESLDKAFRSWAISSQTYSTKEALLKDDFATKGDIIFVWPKKFGSSPENGGESHIGLYWGDKDNPNQMWHSTHDSPSGAEGNVITGIEGKVTGTLYYRVYKVQPNPGRIALNKVSSNAALTEGNSCYSLKGAEYGIFSDKECTQQVDALTTNAAGQAGPSADLNPGTYYVRELKAPRGFALDETVYRTEVESKSVTTVNADQVKDTPQANPVDVLLAKQDAESGKASPLGRGTLEDALFSVDFYGGQFETVAEAEASGDPLRSWVLKTDADGVAKMNDDYKVLGDEFFTDEEGNVVLPLGTLVVRETNPPVGYLANDAAFLRNITALGTGSSVSAFNPLIGNDAVREQVKRGDITFTKRDDSTKETLANVLFRIISKTTGESHVIVTNGEGVYSSSAGFALHTCNTNGNDDAAEEEASAGNGTWFGKAGAETVDPDDGLGALPYDTYEIEELPCAGNEQRQLLTVTVTVANENETVDLGFLDDPVAAVRTIARDGDDGDSYLLQDDEVTIVDSVEYEGLIPNREYTLEGKVIDTASKDTLAIASKTFTPLDANGEEDMVFVLSTLGLPGGTTVCFETLYDSKGRVLAAHENLDDVGQQCHVVAPTLKTSLANDADGGKSVVPATGIFLTDTVEYTGLTVGKEYRIAGELQLKVLEDGKVKSMPLEDARGNAVVASKTFIPETSDGTVRLSFRFDGSHLNMGDACQIVAFERLFLGEAQLAAHEDIDDAAQTVDVIRPSMTSVLKESGVSNGHEAIVSEDTVLEDTVSYKNLQAGAPVRLLSILYDVTAGAPLMTDPLFGYDQQQVQAFCRQLNSLLGIDEGEGDQGEDGAMASGDRGEGNAGADGDGENGVSRDGDAASGAQEPFDVAAFERLLKDNADLARFLAYQDTAFTPESSKGKCTVTFDSFDSCDIANHTIVAFEILVEVDTGHVYALEVDSQNAKQQMEFIAPELRTMAVDAKDGDHNLLAGKDCTIVDTVSYSNLGYSANAPFACILDGVLMDKETGDPVLVDGEEVVATVDFLVEDPTHGSVEVEFGPFDATDLGGKSLVVFEYLYSEDGILLASHENLDSENQTVTVSELTPPPPDTPGDFLKTGASILVPVILGIALLAFGAICIAAAVRTRRRQRLEEKFATALRR